jgi:hypothetical protein
VNLTKIYCKHICKCDNVPSVQQQYDNKNLKEKKIWKAVKENWGILCAEERKIEIMKDTLLKKYSKNVILMKKKTCKPQTRH